MISKLGKDLKLQSYLICMQQKLAMFCSMTVWDKLNHILNVRRVELQVQLQLGTPLFANLYSIFLNKTFSAIKI